MTFSLTQYIATKQRVHDIIKQEKQAETDNQINGQVANLQSTIDSLQAKLDAELVRRTKDRAIHQRDIQRLKKEHEDQIKLIEHSNKQKEDRGQSVIQKKEKELEDRLRQIIQKEEESKRESLHQTINQSIRQIEELKQQLFEKETQLASTSQSINQSINQSVTQRIRALEESHRKQLDSSVRLAKQWESKANQWEQKYQQSLTDIQSINLTNNQTVNDFQSRLELIEGERSRQSNNHERELSVLMNRIESQASTIASLEHQLSQQSIKHEQAIQQTINHTKADFEQQLEVIDKRVRSLLDRQSADLSDWQRQASYWKQRTEDTEHQLNQHLHEIRSLGIEG